MKYPLFGIIYNWKGLKEENYLYTEEELKVARFHKGRLSLEDVDGICNYGRKVSQNVLGWRL